VGRSKTKQIGVVVSERIIRDDLEVSHTLAIALRDLVLRNIGGFPMGADQVSYIVPVDHYVNGSKQSHMISYDQSGLYSVEEVEEGRYPENSVLIFTKDSIQLEGPFGVFGEPVIIEKEALYSL